MNGAPMMLWIEGAVAFVIMSAYVLYALFAFKPEHVEHHPARVRIGAAIQGLTIGLLIGFVLVPLRMQLMEARGVDMPGGAGAQSLAWLPAFLLMIAVRRGVLLKAPVLSTYLRAFRRAGLLKARDDANKALSKLDEIEGRGAPA
ncbi:MAG: hypothetical protein JNM59_03970 [Hyphomonadaceae bacterium]|nr:hypothetical protein [Hyphomonadaceae bacterium]